MSKGFKNIDELFKEGLNNDSPVFCDEYWQEFEHILQNLPPPQQTISPTVHGTPPPAAGLGTGASVVSGVGTGSGIGGALGTALIVKVIVAVATVAVVTTSIWYGVKMTEKKDIPAPTTNTLTIQDKSNEIPGPMDPKATHPFKSNIGFDASQQSTPESSMYPYVQSANTTVDNAAYPDVLNGYDKFSRMASKNKGHSSGIPSESSSEKLGNRPENVIAPDSFVHTTSANATDTGTQENVLSDDDIFKDLIAAESEIVSKSNVLADFADSAAIPAKSDSFALPSEISANPSGVPPVKVKNSLFALYMLSGGSLYQTFGNAAGFDKKANVSLYVGLGLEYSILQNLNLYLEPGFERLRGFELNQSSSINYTLFQTIAFSKTTVQNRELMVFSVPVFLRYKINCHTFSAGPSFLYIISSSGEIDKSELTSTGISLSHDKAENYMSGFDRMQYGIGLEYSFEVFRQNSLLIRYSNYINGMRKSPNEFPGLPDEKLSTFLIGVRINVY